MKKSNIGFPHPVLNSENNDYVDSHFVLIAEEDTTIENNVIHVSLRYDLDSSGLSSLLSKGLAKVVLYSECSVSSFRQLNDFVAGKSTLKIDFPAENLSKLLRLRAILIASAAIENFCLKEHNCELFDNFPFKIHKGDILAISNGFDIDLANIDTLSNRPSIFSIRPDDNAVDSIRVDLFEGGDKINIWLKRDLHEQYQELEKEPTIKLMLSSYFVMPALIEALNFINQGNSTTNSDEYELAKERGWFQAINNRLIGLGIELSDINSMTTIANKLLSDIVCESMGCLRKIKDNILTGDTSGEG